MVLDYYKLREEPFGVTPDPRFLYLSPSHREALASLLCGVQTRRGFMSLIAAPGMGKTTILFELLNKLRDSARTVFLFQTLCHPKDLLRSLLHDLGLTNISEDIGPMQQQLNGVLMAEARQGRSVVVIIDEAQNLEHSSLELLRMLSNFETNSRKLMQIVLAGQPQLRERLSLPHLVQLRQRMSIFSRIDRLNTEETQLYLHHRLQVAGYRHKTQLFSGPAVALIAKYSEGIPRNINNICFNALALGYVLKQESIREDAVLESLQDLDLIPRSNQHLHIEPQASKFVPAQAPIASAKHSPWLRRIALSFVLLLPILWFAGDGRGVAESSSRPIGASRPAFQNPELQFPLVPAHSLQSTAMTTQSTSESLPDASTHHGSTNTPALSLMPSQHKASQLQIAQASVEAGNPAKLWEEVKQQDTYAEVALARLYMDGTAVPKSCEQAQILLLAASRRGNMKAAAILHDFEDKCR
jgi:general secretion pathway protein A